MGQPTLVCVSPLITASDLLLEARRTFAFVGTKRDAALGQLLAERSARSKAVQYSSPTHAVEPMHRRRRSLLGLLPLAAAYLPKTPYEEWEASTAYPHSRGGPYQRCLKAHLVPTAGTYSGCGLLPKTVAFCMKTYSREKEDEAVRQECLDAYYRWWDCVFEACEETHCSYHGACPDQPPDSDYDSVPEESSHPEKPQKDYWDSLQKQPDYWGDFTDRADAEPADESGG